MVEPQKDVQPKEDKRREGKEVESRLNDKGEKEYKHEASGEFVSKSELKKRDKMELATKKKADKEAEKAAKAVAAPEKKQKKQEEELDPTKYRENRQKMIADMREAGENPYPHKFNRTMRIDEYTTRYGELLNENGVFKEDVKESLTGRIHMIRDAGSKLIFIDLVGDEAKV